MIQRPIYDSFELNYKMPFGAVSVGTEVTFRLYFPKYEKISGAVTVVFRPGNKERFEKFVFEKTVDDAYDVYICKYAPHDEGIHFYYFNIIEGGSSTHGGSAPGRGGNGRAIKRIGASRGDFNASELFQLTVYDANYKTPEFLKGGVMYQIFPDRFAKYIPSEDDVDYNAPIFPADRKPHLNWNDQPQWQPDPDGVYRNNDYFGGNLKGITQKLPYLSELGVTCVYLNPIFEAHENHRYCTADYKRIDPLLGNEKDFREMCAEGEKLGISFILDGVFSHTGADSVYFNKNKRYDAKTGAYNDPKSPYREWFAFKKYPDEYESWWGFSSLPNVNENNPSYTEFITGVNRQGLVDKKADSVLKYWLKDTKTNTPGAMGWRLDVADELPDEFIDNIRKGIKSANKEAALYGEVWEDASTKESYGVRRRYLIGNQLDSVMNYPFSEYIHNFTRYGNWRHLVDGVMTICEHYPKQSVDILMNFIGTHDTERALTRLGGERVGAHNREWQNAHSLSDMEFVHGICLLKTAFVLMYFLPGIPCVYYGDETGIEGYKDPFNRATYPWGNEDAALIDYVKGLGSIRNNPDFNEVFAKGNIKFISADENRVLFVRTIENAKDDGGKAVIICVNRSRKNINMNLKTSEILPDISQKYSPNITSVVNLVSGGDIDLSKFKVSSFGFGVVGLVFKQGVSAAEAKSPA